MGMINTDGRPLTIMWQINLIIYGCPNYSKKNIGVFKAFIFLTPCWGVELFQTGKM